MKALGKVLIGMVFVCLSVNTAWSTEVRFVNQAPLAYEVWPHTCQNITIFTLPPRSDKTIKVDDNCAAISAQFRIKGETGWRDSSEYLLWTSGHPKAKVKWTLKKGEMWMGNEFWPEWSDN
ncbi:MAG: hypothetical protein M0009_17595 [Deltaproteobacteria bacterium]|nr:hypothetical protein [Deltaproteobacteria bacterium]